MITNTARELVNGYYEWLKKRTSLKSFGDWAEITTPFLDRHNDFIQLYMKCADGEILLSDDGYTISDLEMSGCEINTKKRKALLETTLNGFGVTLNNGALEVKASDKNFAYKKHSILQAILAVNDLFYASRANVESFFCEDVALWLDEARIRYTPDVSLTGRSKFLHRFDFVIPKSSSGPERILKVINNPNRDTISALAFAWDDTKEARGKSSQAYAILNDQDKPLSKSLREALDSYSISSIPWSTRDSFRDRLAA